ncbi:MAG TPA: penicillin acylase family protein, partial [Candidatus Nanopelagicales bacterium]|nr:penicillin acylase family protein [Candidatus Nanopelagicales bacterium]
SFPQTSGTLTLQGLEGSVDVYRNDRGIPDLYADSPADLFFAQGYVHAQDRFWEMDFRRHITAGRLSEMFGASQLDTDTFLRISGWRRVAEQELALLSPSTRANLEAYAKGVNAYLSDHAGAAVSLEYAVLGLQNPSYTIEPWTPVDSLAWLKAMAWDLRGNMQEEIERSVVSAKIGVERTAQLFPAYPYADHRPIVTQGAVADGVWNQSAVPPIPTTASHVPRIPPDAVPVLSRTRTVLGSLDGVLGPNGPGIGSNSWVVEGRKTSTGLPLLANDPHLGPSMPSIWYQMGLHCRTVSAQCPYDVAGFTFSGLPGVVIGHNQTIGWGFTNLGPDVTDLYLEKVDGDGYLVGSQTRRLTTRTEVIKVAGGDPVTITVRSTEHGPLISDAYDAAKQVGADAPAGTSAPDRGAGYAVALRWTALTPGRTADAIALLDTAQTWQDFRRAASFFEVPAQNLVFASKDGTIGAIGYQTPGRIPIRTGYDGKYPALGWDPKQTWSGYIPFDALPNVLNPDDGWVVTANQASVYQSYPYFLTDDWSYGARSQRIVDLVRLATSGGAVMTPDRMRAIQLDTWTENAAFLVPRITGAKVSGATADAVALLKTWDFTQPRDSAAAAYFNVFWKNLLLDTFGDELPEDYLPSGSDRWFTVVRELWTTPDDPWWDDKRTQDKVETRDDDIVRALDEATTELSGLQGSDPSAWRWGALHTLTVQNQSLGQSGISLIERIFNRGPIETAGGESIVDATGWTAKNGYVVDWVPSMRMVLDLSDLDSSTWVHLTGASGHAYDPHYADQLDAWQNGTTYPWAFTPPAVQAAARDHLVLQP